MLGSGGSIGSCLLHPGQFFGVDRFGEDLHRRLLQRAVPDVAVASSLKMQPQYFCIYSSAFRAFSCPSWNPTRKSR